MAFDSVTLTHISLFCRSFFFFFVPPTQNKAFAFGNKSKENKTRMEGKKVFFGDGWGDKARDFTYLVMLSTAYMTKVFIRRCWFVCIVNVLDKLTSVLSRFVNSITRWLKFNLRDVLFFLSAPVHVRSMIFMLCQLIDTNSCYCTRNLLPSLSVFLAAS